MAVSFSSDIEHRACSGCSRLFSTPMFVRVHVETLSLSVYACSLFCGVKVSRPYAERGMATSLLKELG